MSREAPNGCGPWWVPKNLKDGYFSEACTKHDIDYLNGTDRTASDYKFYSNMLKIIAREPDRKTRFWRSLQAGAFFFIVRTLGWISHKKGLDV